MERGPAVFKSGAEWIAKIVQKTAPCILAPDIFKLGDRYSPLLLGFVVWAK